MGLPVLFLLPLQYPHVVLELGCEWNYRSAQCLPGAPVSGPGGACLGNAHRRGASLLHGAGMHSRLLSEDRTPIGGLWWDHKINVREGKAGIYGYNDTS